MIFSWDNYSDDLSKILDVRNGGLAVHGGLILSFIVGYFLCKKYREGFLNTADLVAPVIALAQSIGRWGNFFNEEAHGGPTDLPWAQIIDGTGYHPTFLYESVWCLLLFIFLMYWSDHRRKFNGQIICLYGILYSAERFLVEGLRTDSLMIGASETGSGHKSGHNSRVRRDLFHIKKTKQIFKIKEIFNEIRYSRSA